MDDPVLGRVLTDGVVSIRPSLPEDNETLVAGRDALFHRFLGEGHPEPNPLACIVVDDVVVGWIDYDAPRPWLTDGEVNVGYGLSAEHRGNGYATRALQLLVTHLAEDTDVVAATLLIDPDNDGSLAVAHRAGFTRHDDVEHERFYKCSTVTADGARRPPAGHRRPDDPVSPA